ncbi:MAG: nuclear transport factor 2 family protein [Pseudomonadota bacterium]
MQKLVLLCLWVPLVLYNLKGANAGAQTLEDRFQISDQISRYAQLWDRKDADAFSELFTEDGVLEWHFADASEQPPSLSGRDNILKYARKAHAGRLAGRQSRHHFSGLVFESLTAETALTEHMFMVTHVLSDEPPIVRSTGVYKIEWRKTDNSWLMSHRKLLVDRRAD